MRIYIVYTLRILEKKNNFIIRYLIKHELSIIFKVKLKINSTQQGLNIFTFIF